MSDENGDIVYGEPDENGVEVAGEGAADTKLVGTWRHDSISGTIRDLMKRIMERTSHGDPAVFPLKVYKLGQNGTLFLCSLHTHPPANGYREVHVSLHGEPLVSARFKV